MSIFKLSEVEAFRAQVLLDEALKKLLFLTSISSSASVHGEIGRKLSEDRAKKLRIRTYSPIQGVAKSMF